MLGFSRYTNKYYFCTGAKIKKARAPCGASDAMSAGIRRRSRRYPWTWSGATQTVAC